MNRELLSRDNNVQLQLSTCYIHDVTYKQRVIPLTRTVIWNVHLL